MISLSAINCTEQAKSWKSELLGILPIMYDGGEFFWKQFDKSCMTPEKFFGNQFDKLWNGGGRGGVAWGGENF